MRIIAILLSLVVTITGCGMVENSLDSSNDSKVINQKLEVIKKDTNDTTNPIDNGSDNEVKNTVEPWESSTSPYTYHCGVEKCPGHLIDYDVVSSSDLPVCEEDTSFTIDISMVGDVMLASYKGQKKAGSFAEYAETKDPSYFLSEVQEVFANDDFTIVNLENVFTDNNIKEVAKDHNPAYWYKAPTSNKNILIAGSVEAVSLANNHTGDYGNQGRKDTIEAMESINMPYGNNDTTIYLEKEGFKIAVVCHGLWSKWQASQIIPRIVEAKEQADYVIVFHHGGTERVHKSDNWRIEASRQLVDAGADLVIGNHPHVLQPEEIYNGKHIVYSLGNFCFGGNSKPENRTIIYKVLLTIDDDKVVSEETNIIPCYVYDNPWQPKIITDEVEKQKVLDFMAGERELPY